MTTIVLLSCSKSWSENSIILSTGGVSDSVLVAVDDLRAANAKMIELKYEKEINADLRQIVKNDSVVVNALKQEVNYNQAQSKKYKKQRNVVGGAGIGVLILLVISLL